MTGDGPALIPAFQIIPEIFRILFFVSERSHDEKVLFHIADGHTFVENVELHGRTSSSHLS